MHACMIRILSEYGQVCPCTMYSNSKKTSKRVTMLIYYAYCNFKIGIICSIYGGCGSDRETDGLYEEKKLANSLVLCSPWLFCT